MQEEKILPIQAISNCVEEYLRMAIAERSKA